MLADSHRYRISTKNFIKIGQAVSEEYGNENSIGIWSELQALCKGHRFVGPLPKLKKYLFSSLIVVPDTTQSLSHEGAPILVQLVERTNVADEALVATLGIYAEPPTMDSDGYWKEIQIERTKTQEKGNTINIPNSSLSVGELCFGMAEWIGSTGVIPRPHRKST
uniref:SFRICE_020649 n=1 Tax=Spodoptera frugiperda TaxID=7108 RepID=A0A2H1VLR6_SPOFR